MTPLEALMCVNEAACLNAVAPEWERSMAASQAGCPAWLEPAAIRESAAWCGLGDEAGGALVETAGAIADSPALRALAWHCAWRLYESSEPASMSAWPRLESVLGERCGVFYLLVGLAMVPRVRRHHAALGFPETVTRETCLEVKAFSGNYRMSNDGRLGLPRQQVYWLRHYTREPYVRIGRLEYWLKPFGGGVVVYRHRHSGEVLALAENGARFDAQGYLPRGSDTAKLETGWTAVLAESAERVSGHPVTPWGRGLRETVDLPLSDWERVLAKGDWVLQVHIPAGGGMDPEGCNDSMRQAVAFFREHIADRRAVAVQTGSWIYNPDLERFLPGDSNLVRHLRETHLYPIPSGGSDGLWFVFFQDRFDPTTAPRQTRLQRAILGYLEAGNDWRCSGMFVLAADVARLGTEPYRRAWPPSVLRGGV